MTNEELNEVKVNLELIFKNITKMIAVVDISAENMSAIDNEIQPEEFKEAVLVHSQTKNQLILYLLTVVDNVSLTLLDVIEYVQSSPKAKLWVPS